MKVIFRSSPNGGRVHLALGGASIAALYGSALWLPEALLPVFVAVVMVWSVISPDEGFLLLFPCIAPFLMVEIPEIRGASLVPIFTACMALACLLRPKQFYQKLNSIPKYALVGIGWLLAVEVISGLFFSPSYLAKIAVFARCAKAAQFMLAAAFASQAGSLAKVESGWIFYGVLQVLAAVALQVITGSVLSTRGTAVYGELIQLGSVGSVAVLIAGFGYMSIASSWFAISAASRKKGLARYLLWAFAVLSLGAAFYSGRRQALLAALFSAILAGVTIKGRRKLGVALTGALVLIGFYLSGPLQEFLAGRTSLAVEVEGAIEGSRESSYGPINLAGIAAFLGSPWTGIGLGNYIAATEDMNILSRSGNFGGPRQGESPHNSVIRVLAETGLLGGFGLAILSCGFVVALIRVVISLRASPGFTSMRFVLPSISLVFVGYTITILDQPEYMFIFGTFVGLMHQYLNGTLEANQAKLRYPRFRPWARPKATLLDTSS